MVEVLLLGFIEYKVAFVAEVQDNRFNWGKGSPATILGKKQTNTKKTPKKQRKKEFRLRMDKVHFSQ